MSIGPSKLSVVPSAEPDLPCLGHIKTLLRCKTARVVPPQHIIFSQGESPHTLCLICNGIVKLTRTEANGERAIVGLRKPGWLLGTAAILPGLPYASTAETVTRSKLCFVPVETFNQVMRTNLQFAQWVLLMLSRGVYSSVLSISGHRCLSGRQRFENFLLEIIKDLENPKVERAFKIPILLKRWEIAQLIGLTPEHLSRLIRQMENEGIIARKNGWLVFRDPKALLHLVRTQHNIDQ